MKWPKWIKLMRHDTSEYNLLKGKKKVDPMYQDFLKAWKVSQHSSETQMLARQVSSRFRLGVGDAKTKLADENGRQAYETGLALAKVSEVPDVIFVSPYERTQATLKHLSNGWKALKDVQVIEEERVREQEHGLALLDNDWRVFHTLHPEQKMLYELEGPYWYRYPQGESVPDVRARVRSFVTTLIRDWAEKRVLVVTHHLSILAFRAHLERLDSEEFIRLDKKEKPINCGITLYRGDPHVGKDGRLILDFYNKKFYK